MKYAVIRNPSNYKEVNEYMSKLNNRNYTATGKCRPDGINDQNYDYVHYPTCGTKTVYHSVYSGYTPIAFENFKQIINNKTQQMATQQFKPGDRVVITFWHHDSRLPVPCKGTYVEETPGNPPHKIKLDNPYSERHDWYFREGEFRHQKPQTFLIQGKPHQVRAIAEDLKELGYIFDQINNPHQGVSIFPNWHMTSPFNIGKIEKFRGLYIGGTNIIQPVEVKFQLPDQYKEALDFAAEQLKPEYWEPPKPVEEKLTIGIRSTEVTVGKGFIRARDANFDYTALKQLWEMFISMEKLKITSSYNIGIPISLRFLRIGCESENNLFSAEDIKKVIDIYEKLNS